MAVRAADSTSSPPRPSCICLLCNAIRQRSFQKLIVSVAIPQRDGRPSLSLSIVDLRNSSRLKNNNWPIIVHSTRTKLSAASPCSNLGQFGQINIPRFTWPLLTRRLLLFPPWLITCGMPFQIVDGRSPDASCWLWLIRAQSLTQSFKHAVASTQVGAGFESMRRLRHHRRPFCRPVFGRRLTLSFLAIVASFPPHRFTFWSARSGVNQRCLHFFLFERRANVKRPSSRFDNSGLFFLYLSWIWKQDPLTARKLLHRLPFQLGNWGCNNNYKTRSSRNLKEIMVFRSSFNPPFNLLPPWLTWQHLHVLRTGMCELLTQNCGIPFAWWSCGPPCSFQGSSLVGGPRLANSKTAETTGNSKVTCKALHSLEISRPSSSFKFLTISDPFNITRCNNRVIAPHWFNKPVTFAWAAIKAPPWCSLPESPTYQTLHVPKCLANFLAASSARPS